MPVPQQNWRPSDADRERYSTILSDAFTAGRIDAAGLSERNAKLYAATSIGELDTLVGDLPGPPGERPPRPASPATRRLVGTVVAVVTAAVVGYALSPEDADPGPPVTVAEEQPAAPEAEVPPADPAPDLPPIATVKQNMFTAEALAELWATVPATGVAEIWDLTLHADRASLVVRSPVDPNHLANVDYEAGLPFPETLNREVAEGEAFFGWNDVTPEAVATAIAATPAAGGKPDSQVSHVMIERNYFYDHDVTIRVYQEGEAPSVIWAADGTELLDVL